MMINFMCDDHSQHVSFPSQFNAKNALCIYGEPVKGLPNHSH